MRMKIFGKSFCSGCQVLPKSFCSRCKVFRDSFCSEIVVCSCFILRFSSVLSGTIGVTQKAMTCSTNTNHHKPAAQAHCTLPAFVFFKGENSLQNGFLKVYYKMQKKCSFCGMVEIENVRIRVTTKWVKKINMHLKTCT